MTLSEKCKKHYAAHLTLNHDDFRTFFLQLGCSSATLLIVFFYIYPSLSPPPPFYSPLCECCCFFPLCSEEPQGSGGEDVSQGAVWCSAFCGPACPRRADRQQLHGPRRHQRGHRAPGLFKTRVQSSTKHLAFQTLTSTCSG